MTCALLCPCFNFRLRDVARLLVSCNAIQTLLSISLFYFGGTPLRLGRQALLQRVGGPGAQLPSNTRRRSSSRAGEASRPAALPRTAREPNRHLRCRPSLAPRTYAHSGSHTRTHIVAHRSAFAHCVASPLRVPWHFSLTFATFGVHGDLAWHLLIHLACVSFSFLTRPTFPTRGRQYQKCPCHSHVSS